MSNESTTMGFGLFSNDIPNYFPDGKGMSDRFLFIEDPNLLWNQDGEGFAIVDYLHFRISKSKLATQDAAGFKAWLRDNPIKVLYQLKNPTVEIVDSCTDLNIGIFKDITYIKSVNRAPGVLDFKIPNNLYSVANTSASNINNMNSELDNHEDRVDKLEESMLTTSMNILNLQDNLNNAEQYASHSGTTLTCTNTICSRTEGMVIKGMTLQNLVKMSKGYAQANWLISSS